jgi:hypothetical protein
MCWFNFNTTPTNTSQVHINSLVIFKVKYNLKFYFYVLIVLLRKYIVQCELLYKYLYGLYNVIKRLPT